MFLVIAVFAVGSLNIRASSRLAHCIAPLAYISFFVAGSGKTVNGRTQATSNATAFGKRAKIIDRPTDTDRRLSENHMTGGVAGTPIRNVFRHFFSKGAETFFQVEFPNSKKFLKNNDFVSSLS